jgi:Spy/CpxP family protein refolding chaperone
MRALSIVVALILSVSTSAAAQSAPPGGGGGDDPLARFLYPPELVMANQQALSLTDRQRSTIQQEMQQAQAKFTDLQWKMSGEGEKLARLLQATPVPETQVLEQVDRILGIERDVKRTHLTLLMRIKNALTADQQAKLSEMRRQAARGRSEQAP